jgi:GT2 family glycosyltransferase
MTMAEQTTHQAAAGQLVAVVVTFNRVDQLTRTVTRLLETPEALLETVLVIDNASTDGTEDWLAAQDDPRLVVYRCVTNSGGAGGFELGMRMATERFDPDWIVVMDDDARPASGALAAFHAEDRSSAEAWGAAVYFPGPEQQICDMNRPAINPFWHKGALRRTILGKGRDGFHLGPADYAADAGVRAVDTASFVGLFISRAAVERVGYPDGRLFIYGDDTLYTLGLARAGGRILFDPALVFLHAFSTHSRTDKRFRPLWKSYYHYRNLMMVYRLCAGRLFVFVAPAAAAKWLLKVRHHSGERRAFVGYVLRALRDGILRRTDVSHEAVKSWAGKR